MIYFVIVLIMYSLLNYFSWFSWLSIKDTNLPLKLYDACHHHSMGQIYHSLSRFHLSKIDSTPIFVFTCKCQVSFYKNRWAMMGDNNSVLLNQLSGRIKVPLRDGGYIIIVHSFGTSFCHQVTLKLSNRSATPWWIFRRTYTTSGV